MAKQRLGQHWLEDLSTLESIVELAEVNKTDTVLEIGPGKGSLTKLLLKRAARVIGVEIDSQLVDRLRQLEADNFSVSEADILKFDFSSVGVKYKIVANIPYYLTGHLIRQLASLKHPPIRAVLLVQKEVADRLAAQPGQMSLLAIVAQSRFLVRSGPVVPASLFKPPPKVDSRVVILDRLDNTSPDNFDRVVLLARLAFAMRRKTLSNSLGVGLSLPRAEVNMMLKRAGVEPGHRPQELGLDDWIRLSNQVYA